MITDENGVRQMVRDECARIGITKFAKSAGVTRSYVYAVLSGDRAPGRKILIALKLEKVIGYLQKNAPPPDISE